MSNLSAPIKDYIVACSDDNYNNPMFKELSLCSPEWNDKVIENTPKERLMYWVNDAISSGYVPYGDLIITSHGIDKTGETIYCYHQALVKYS